MIILKLPREQKTEIMERVVTFFEEERSERIGELGAEQFVDFMLKELGPYIYNQALEDVRKLVTEKMNQIDDELYSLEQPLPKSR
ncbi:DUF2164 family protein [Cohnella sp. CFH 77786]|uniref:DUF2164 domain-containing protein n=1 Tax=Cohnella sp. CFH 77786 TaxID=2662265 RepID=UPI001C60D08C|nr:DUF2164 domain-containing protein [Cohnella sp. CFH 77786]MBW5446523.1 DUF2164 family protein [Cohnella sp. CFH 77786]